MARFFNTAGACDPDDHYMLPAEGRLPAIDRLIERKSYFVVHAPRQTGKTTAFHALAHRLTAEGNHTALLTSCETGQSLESDLEGSITALLETLEQNAEQDLPAELRPPAADPELSPCTHLVFQAFLQKVVNSGGYIDREYAAGRGRMDLCVRWPLPDGQHTAFRRRA